MVKSNVAAYYFRLGRSITFKLRDITAKRIYNTKTDVAVYSSCCKWKVLKTDENRSRTEFHFVMGVIEE